MRSHEKPSDRIGERVAFYRRMNGYSAAELSERTLGTISKGVIANIETGRKRDLTVDELITLSWALGVPPIALALPVESPDAGIYLADGDLSAQVVTVAEVARWFLAPALPTQAGFPAPLESSKTASGALATSRVNALFRWWSDLLHLTKIKKQQRSDGLDADELASLKARRAEVEKEIEFDEELMRSFGMTRDDHG